MHPPMTSLFVGRKKPFPPRSALVVSSRRQANAGPAFRMLAELENELRSGQVLPAVRPPAGLEDLSSQQRPAIRIPLDSSIWPDRGNRAPRDLEAAACSPTRLSDPLSVLKSLLIPEVREIETLEVRSSLRSALGTGPPGNHGLQVATDPRLNVRRPPAPSHIPNNTEIGTPRGPPPGGLS
jgi:hypothetical protein